MARNFSPAQGLMLIIDSIRVRAIGSRWLTVLLVGMLGGLVAAALSGILQANTSWALIQFAPARARLIALAVVGLCLAVIYKIGTRPSLGLLGFKHFFAYPPTWVSVVFGVYVWASLVRWGAPGLVQGTEGAAVLILNSSNWAIFGLGLVAAAHLGRHYWQHSHIALAKPTRSVSKPSALATADFRWVEGWIATDDAIRSPDDDQFGHEVVAERIARRLREDDQLATVSLIGVAGSGKSTIMNLAKAKIQSDGRFVWVNLSLWPFKTPEAAIQGILTSIVGAMAAEVDTLALTAVPSEYLEVIKATGGRFGFLSALLASKRTPQQLIEAIGSIAAATGIRIVVWTEDLERFSGPEDRNARLTLVWALAHLLGQAPTIAVVLSDTSSNTEFDVDKVARFAERPPVAKLSEVARLYGVFRNECLGGWPTPFIDAASGDARARFNALDGGDEMAHWLYSYGDDVVHPEYALCCLARTPRSLKNSLRNTHDRWRILVGEVDFDSLLVATVLRESAPNVFAAIDRNIDAIRAGFKSGFLDRNPQNSPQWKSIELALESTGEDAKYVKCLVNYLFPSLPGSKHSDGNEKDPPQGFASDGYWERFTSGDAVASEERDQLVLKEISAWSGRRENSLPMQLRERALAAKVARFGAQFPVSELGRLIEDASDGDSEVPATGWGDGAYAPATVAAWRVILNRPDRDEPSIEASVDRMIRKHLPRHLPAAKTLDLFFAVEETSNLLILGQPARRRIRRVVEECLVGSFASSVEDAAHRLSLALMDGGPWIFYQLVWGLDRIRRQQTSGRLPFDDWHLLADTVLGLARADRGVGVPMLLTFVTQTNHRSRFESGNVEDHLRASFLRADAELLFGVENLKTVIPGPIVASDVDTQTRWRKAIEALATERDEEDSEEPAKQ